MKEFIQQGKKSRDVNREMSTDSVSNTLYYISNIYSLSACAFNVSLGLIGNILVILFFTNFKLFRANQSSFYIVSESVSNIGLLLAVYSSHIYRAITGDDPTLKYLSWCKIRGACAEIFGFCSLFAICWSTFDQYLSTNHRYTLRQCSSLKLARRLVLSTVCFIVVHDILLFVFLETGPIRGCTLYQPIITRYYSFFYYPVLSTVLPFFITTTFSIFAYRNVRRIVRRQMPIVRRRLDRQMTALVLARVICLIICGFPYVLVTLYELNQTSNHSNFLKLSINALLSTIFNSLIYTHWAINFYVFLLVSSRFRRQVKYFLLKQCCQSMKLRLTTLIDKSLDANQVAPEPTEGTISVID